MVATLALLLATLRSTATLGPLLALAIGLMLVAALTLVPAILTILGRFSFWPFRPNYDVRSNDPAIADEEAHGIWSRVAGVVARRPVGVLVSTVTVFLVMSLGLLQFEQTYDQITGLPEGTESREGFELLREAFPAGELAPTDVYVRLPEGSDLFAPDTLARVDQVALALASTDGVSAVSGPSRPFGTGGGPGPDQVAAAAASLPVPVRDAIRAGEDPASGEPPSDPALGEAIALYAVSAGAVSRSGNVAALAVTLDENPYGPAALAMVPDLRQTAKDAAERAGLARDAVLVGGETATVFDTREANDRDTLIVLPLILLAIGVILALLLRSLVAPLYLLATIILSYTATLGISTFVFTTVLGQEGVSGGTPFFLFVFLVALGVDYNIFLMVRIREETGRYGLAIGTRRALGRTGGVITSAGLILAGTFGALMTLPLQDLFQLGFAVALGVLLDTFIVRSLMVPAIVLLLGRWNWWPGTAGVAGMASTTGTAQPVPTGD
ncbi:MAG: hypothetical protein AVDCRST_MAG70-713 [uncultured Thermomicrobiales bacterium]|uniref:SSD domain-containing protein n=1 Tax=uncultured Thermomicrobiales bacterium TaxID=1645740 RepID=A0A6J4UEH2_9BACT|nr:MAG: hypothetical protein AVDCRST_MAG70-713 [uncultured Thermomicrobiales bacterium]